MGCDLLKGGCQLSERVSLSDLWVLNRGIVKTKRTRVIIMMTRKQRHN